MIMNCAQRSDYFSSSYVEARSRFNSKAQVRGLVVTTYTFAGKGVAGEALTADTVELGDPRSSNVLFIVSGTHGVEGFAGSACQLAVLDQIDALKLGNCRIVLVHALNPFGFSYFRRSNEYNVDINRNFLTSRPTAIIDKNREHAVIRQLRKTSNGYQSLKLSLMLVWQIIQGKKAALQSLITAGQYENERDLFFGGTTASASAQFWQDLLVKYQSNSLYLMDIHTGLGKRGQAYILSEAQKSSAQYQDNHRFFKHCNLVHTANDVSISSQLRGTLSSRLPEPDKAITLEYGTRGGLSVLCALALENYHYWHNRGKQPHRQSADRLKEIFIPQSRRWRAGVIESFWQILERQIQLIHSKPKQGSL